MSVDYQRTRMPQPEKWLSELRVAQIACALSLVALVVVMFYAAWVAL